MFTCRTSFSHRSVRYFLNHDPERSNQPETVEKKFAKLSGNENLDSDAKRGFNDLASELSSQDQYNTHDLKDAASKRINTMMQSGGVRMSDLSDDERTRLDVYKNQMLHVFDNGNTEQALTAYNTLRQKIAGTLAAGSGKGEKDKDNLRASQEQRATERNTTEQAFDQWKKLVGEIFDRQENDANKAETQRLKARQLSDASCGISNTIAATDAQMGLRDWPA